MATTETDESTETPATANTAALFEQVMLELAKPITDRDTLAFVQFFWSLDEELPDTAWDFLTVRVQFLEGLMCDQHGWTV